MWVYSHYRQLHSQNIDTIYMAVSEYVRLTSVELSVTSTKKYNNVYIGSLCLYNQILFNINSFCWEIYQPYL